MNKKSVLQHPVFDGDRIWEGATVVIENGVISDETILCDGKSDSGCFLMPGLIDAHTHISKEKQLNAMIRSGITATCDVCIPKSLKSASEKLYVHTSYSMALGDVSDGRACVEDAVSNGSEYIKVILEEPARMAPKTMDKAVLRDIAAAAHEHGLQVAVHAVTLPMVWMAVEAGADILIHVPMKERISQELAQLIAGQGISIVPTLVMMEAFAKSLFFGYQQADYADAVENVRLLHSMHVSVLVGTDANDSFFVPNIEHGAALHKEMQLLVEAGISPLV